jgi:hypothetical protein
MFIDHPPFGTGSALGERASGRRNARAHCRRFDVVVVKGSFRDAVDFLLYIGWGGQSGVRRRRENQNAPRRR